MTIDSSEHVNLNTSYSKQSKTNNTATSVTNFSKLFRKIIYHSTLFISSSIFLTLFSILLTHFYHNSLESLPRQNCSSSDELCRRLCPLLEPKIRIIII